MRRQQQQFDERGHPHVPAANGGRQLIESEPGRVPATRLKTVKRSFFGLLISCGVLGGLALVCFVALHVRLGQGPIAVDFLVAPIEKSINRDLAGLRLRISSAILKYPETGYGLQFRLRDVELLDDRGAVVAQAPLAAINVNGAALALGQFAPDQVVFIRPRILLYYDESNGLVVSFSRPTATPGRSAATVQRSTAAPASIDTSFDASRSKINLAATLAKALANARDSRSTTSHLANFGVQDATVILDQDGHQTHWTVPEFSVDLRHHKKRSFIKGEGQVLTMDGPWSLAFQVEESEKNRSLKLKLDIDGLVPRAVASAVSNLSFLAALDMPIKVNSVTELTSAGDVKSADVAIALKSGEIALGGTEAQSVALRDGALKLRYLRDTKNWQVLPSRLRGRAGEVTVVGRLTTVPRPDGDVWRFDLKGTDAIISGPGAVGSEPVEAMGARGTIDLAKGLLQLDALQVLLREGAVMLSGRISQDVGISLTGQLTSVPTISVNRLWPEFLAPSARQWFAERVTGGVVSNGHLNVSMPPDFIPRLREGADVPNEAVSLVLEGLGQTIDYSEGMPPLQLGRVKVRVAGRRFMLDAPEGALTLPSGQRLALKAGRFIIPDLREATPEGRVTFKTSSSIDALTEFLSLAPLAYLTKPDALVHKLSGQSHLDLALAFPLSADLKREQVQIAGRARLEDLSAKQLVKDIDLDGGTVSLDVSQHTIEARGDVLLNGVVAELRWLRLVGATVEQQPPLRLTATLDDNDREQLGLAINHLLKGPAIVDLSISDPESEHPAMHVQVDLTNAALTLDNMAWRKPPGQSAVLRFDVHKGDKGRTELQNFKIIGNAIAIDGWVALGSDRRLTSFYFPEFSFDVITQLEISGNLASNDVWKIKVKGRTYDGREFFRSLFSAEQLGKSRLPPSKRRAGMDIEARIETVVGFSDASLRNLRMEVQKRGGLLTSFKASGKLDTGAPIGVRLARDSGGKRHLLAETTDAGRAFKLVGFYSSIENGDASLKVNLDGQGAAAKTGTLWTRNFTVLGDPVVREVLSETPGTPQGRGKRRTGKYKTERLRLQFDQMRLPFSVGHGQFVLHDSYINGPVIGATLRGKVDYNRQTVLLSGTYIPLYGLNAALGAFPIIGNLLVGRRGEGTFGITFAISGPLANPQVAVNPMSMIAPGIFRQIFEFQQVAPRVNPRTASRAKSPHPKSSSAPAIIMPHPGPDSGWRVQENESGGWRVETVR